MTAPIEKIPPRGPNPRRRSTAEPAAPGRLARLIDNADVAMAVAGSALICVAVTVLASIWWALLLAGVVLFLLGLIGV